MSIQEKNNKYAVHFGSGNIGRGFIGKLLSESGYHVTFVDIQQNIIEAIQEKKQYTVEILSDNGSAMDTVTNVDGILNTPQNLLLIKKAISNADLVTTAVGVSILDRIAPTIAEALEYRLSNTTKPLNIIACENKVGASTLLHNAIKTHLSDTTILDQKVGFPCCGVDRIVVNKQYNDVLTVCVEEYSEWCIDSTAFVGEVPYIKEVVFTDTLQSFVERKLFTLNTGHAITAYLGYLYKYHTIDQAIKDRTINAIVKSAMEESSAALVQEWGLSMETQKQYVQKILGRFSNTALQDAVVRVARDPLRKLADQDRLIMPLTKCRKHSLSYDNLLIGIAGALLFDETEDKEAVSLQEQIQAHGIASTLASVCNITDASLIKAITNCYNTLKNTCS